MTARRVRASSIARMYALHSYGVLIFFSAVPPTPTLPICAPDRGGDVATRGA
jgi:hypothetical protein